MELSTQFLEQFRKYYGKPFEIVSGRNAYTFDKERHAKMMAKDGIYLLLENPPQDNLKYKYDKALFIAARSADKFFPTNDPAKVKSSFHLGADKMRFEFHQQQHKLYQMQSCIIKTVQFKDTRRDFRIERKDYDYLIKNDGVFVFLYTVGDKPNLIMEVAILSAKSIVGFVTPKGEKKTSLTLHFELSAYTLKLLDDLNLRSLLTKEPKPVAVVEPISKSHVYIPQEEVVIGDITFKDVDNYLGTSLPIRIIFPEGKTELILTCTITKTGTESCIMFGNVQPNFAIETTPLFEKAVKWWGMHCPCAYTLKQHIANPEVNIPDKEGRELGIEIAKILKDME